MSKSTEKYDRVRNDEVRPISGVDQKTKKILIRNNIEDHVRM